MNDILLKPSIIKENHGFHRNIKQHNCF